MEACDDIAYSVIDSEDAVKKGLVSFNDLMMWLRMGDKPSDAKDQVIEYVCQFSEEEHKRLQEQRLDPAELNDVTMQKFRTTAIHVMVNVVLKAFADNYEDIMSGRFRHSLVDVSQGAELYRAQNFIED